VQDFLLRGGFLQVDFGYVSDFLETHCAELKTAVISASAMMVSRSESAPIANRERNEALQTRGTKKACGSIICLNI
jgi:hypothetical protein